MKDLLKPLLENEIGINIRDAFHIESVFLKGIEDDYFTVFWEDNGNTYHIPYTNIIRILQNGNGVTVGGLFQQKKTYALVVKVGHIVQYVA